MNWRDANECAERWFGRAARKPIVTFLADKGAEAVGFDISSIKTSAPIIEPQRAVLGLSGLIFAPAVRHEISARLDRNNK